MCVAHCSPSEISPRTANKQQSVIESSNVLVCFSKASTCSLSLVASKSVVGAYFVVAISSMACLQHFASASFSSRRLHDCEMANRKQRSINSKRVTRFEVKIHTVSNSIRKEMRETTGRSTDTGTVVVGRAIELDVENDMELSSLSVVRRASGSSILIGGSPLTKV